MHQGEKINLISLIQIKKIKGKTKFNGVEITFSVEL